MDGQLVFTKDIGYAFRPCSKKSRLLNGDEKRKRSENCLASSTGNGFSSAKIRVFP